MSRPFGRTRTVAASWSVIIRKRCFEARAAGIQRGLGLSHYAKSRDYKYNHTAQSCASRRKTPRTGGRDGADKGGTSGLRTTWTAGTVGGDWELKTHSPRSGRQDHGLRCFGDGSTATSRPEGSLLGAEQFDPDGDGQNLASKAPFPGRSGKTTVSKLTGIPHLVGNSFLPVLPHLEA
ncbi:hypothetical protein CF327_g7429 [Tilletia walkeri]|nr:hypothetical protein CF327_g7429 [Tilletia walkeri]